MNMEVKNNQVTIRGEIVSGFTYSHEIFGEKFYLVDVKVPRLSENYDFIPVMVSERLIDVNYDCTGMYVLINGQFRSYNRHEERKNRLVLSVFARDIEFVEELQRSAESNQIYLEGYVCQVPTYRKTPFGREITDVLLAVNRPYGRSDYIPCICWGRNARYVNFFKPGDHVAISGRIQSREYNKRISDECVETRIAYEVSIAKLEVLHDKE